MCGLGTYKPNDEACACACAPRRSQRHKKMYASLQHQMQSSQGVRSGMSTQSLEMGAEMGAVSSSGEVTESGR